MAKLGTGSTITFATSGFTAELISIDGPNQVRESVQTTHMTTANNYHTAIPAALVDGGEMDIELAYDESTTNPPLTGATERVTVNWGSGTTLQWVFDAFVTGFSPGAEIDERMTATMTLKVADDIS